MKWKDLVLLKQNIVSQILFYIGICIIGISFIFGIVLSNAGAGFDDVYYEQTFDWGAFFSMVLTGFISGMAFIGISEIIKLLHSINFKMNIDESRNVESKSFSPLASSTSISSRDNIKTWVVDGTDQEMVLEMELLQNAQLIEIIPTPYIRYGVVIIEQEDARLERVVDFGGFYAVEVEDQEIVEKVLKWYDEQN